MILLLSIILLIALIIIFILIMNDIHRYSVQIEESKADIEIYLIQRYDILMESLKITKKYIEHEKDIMINITKIRKGTNIEEIQNQLKNQEEYMNKFFATAESYPELYSNELFKNLQIQISDTNEHLSAAKRLYNSNVSYFNQYIVCFPKNIVAKILKETKREFLKDDEAEKKKEVSMDFE